MPPESLTTVGALAIILMTIEIPQGVLAALREDPLTFVRELQIRAAVKWYKMKCISQIRATEIAGVSCSEFIEALGRFGVSPFQYSAAAIAAEAQRASELGCKYFSGDHACPGGLPSSLN
jgi:hypothetical protein